MQRLQEDVTHLDTEKQEHESTTIEQQDHIEQLQDNCQELQEAAQAVQHDSDIKYAASIAQMKQERKQQVLYSDFFAVDCTQCSDETRPQTAGIKQAMPLMLLVLHNAYLLTCFTSWGPTGRQQTEFNSWRHLDSMTAHLENAAQQPSCTCHLCLSCKG